MRVGTNPHKSQTTDYRPARVTVCVLVSIPNKVGYYAHRLDAVKLCLSSIIKHTAVARYDLLVFDNGSCPEVVEFLRALNVQGHIQYLLLSGRNIGKANAYRVMFQAAPGEIIAYSDDDILFYPGWLEAQVNVLETFPRTGMVSGVPVREQFRYGNRYLTQYLADFPEVTVKRGRFIPDTWERDFFASTGRDAAQALEATRGYEDVILTHRSVSAYSTAVHFQFVTWKAVILKGVETDFHSQLMSQPVLDVDERIDALGYARLSTTERYVRHIGNVVSRDFAHEITLLGLDDQVSVWTPPGPVARYAARASTMVQRLLNWRYFANQYRTLR